MSAQNIELLAQDKEFEILGSRGTASKEEQTEHLAQADRNKTEDHGPIFADRGHRSISPGQGVTLMWHPSGAKFCDTHTTEIPRAVDNNGHLRTIVDHQNRQGRCVNLSNRR